MQQPAPAHRRVLCEDLEMLESELEITASAGRPSPWVARLREQVRAVRERLQGDR